MDERIRFLRKKIGLSRAAFGQRIGVSGDVINNLERGRVEIKEPMIKLICSEFSVNEEWLRIGEGEMFIETPSSAMEQLKREFDLDDFSYNLVYQYLKLGNDQRQTVRDFFYSVVSRDKEVSATLADVDLEAPTMPTDTSAAEAVYEKSLGIAPSGESTASNTIDDTENAG